MNTKKVGYRDYLNLLITYLRPQAGRVFLLAVLLLGGIGLQLVNPQLVRRFLDTAENGRSLTQLTQTAILFISIAILAQILQLLGTYLGEHIAWTATNNLRADLALHCLRLNMSFHKTHKPGELIERVDGDINSLSNFFSQLVIQLGTNLLLVIGVMGLLWLVDWRVGVTISLLFLMGLFLLNRINRHLVPRWQAVRQIQSDLFGYLEEWLSGTEEIQTNGAKAFIMRQLYNLLRQRWRRTQSAMYLNLLVMGLPIFIPTLAYVAAYLWGEVLFRSSVLTVGGIYLIFYYVDLVKSPLWVIQRQVQDLQQAAASMNRIVALLAEQPDVDEGQGEMVPSGPLAVQFDHVSFYYADDKETRVLEDIHFTLLPGRVLGLLGRTGSGKTTLTRLLFRFYDPTSGVIRLGDGNGRFTNLRHFTQSSLRQRIGMVTQEVELFHASVRDNLTLFDPTIDDQHILAALNELGMTTWLANLPDGLDTRLEAGHNLSAGEAQLLALARVFLADPGLVILDEASSRLDPATEALIERAIDRLLVGRTAIIIAHRLGTVQRADEIMILGDGRILEYGDRLQLATNPNSRFAQLLRTGLETTYG